MAKEFTELVAWQRADALELFMRTVLKRPAIIGDVQFCRQAADSAASGPRNIAEGFGRFGPVQFAQYLRIAIGSEQETKNQVIKAWQRGFINDEEREAGLLLAKRAVTSATSLRRYLLTSQARANARNIEDRTMNPDEP